VNLGQRVLVKNQTILKQQMVVVGNIGLFHKVVLKWIGLMLVGLILQVMK
jgi:hypothetical protein